MRVVIVGLGIQGQKRKLVAEGDVVASIDPIHKDAKYKSIFDVPLGDYDSALLCIPDEPKFEIVQYLLNNKKHLLVEKPLFASSTKKLEYLKNLALQNKVTCYTAYNHRFEPHFIRMKNLLDSKELGRIYSVRMFYGNGTAQLVRESAWRDKGYGVLNDLGSHLLDTALFWFGKKFDKLKIESANRFENRSYDHINFSAQTDPLLKFEISLLSWRNHFYTDIFAEKGSAHINSLCKWGPSTFTFRNRKRPSGRPDENSVTLIQSDPTWSDEYKYFKEICKLAKSNIDNDIWINHTLQALSISLDVNS